MLLNNFIDLLALSLSGNFDGGAKGTCVVLVILNNVIGIGHRMYY